MGRKKLVSDEQLLKVARQVFVERSFAASTREISRRAGVSEALVFQRYATKADLFLAAMAPPAFDLKSCLPDSALSQPANQSMRALFFGLLGYFRSAAPVLVQLMANQDFEFEKFAAAHPDNTLVTLRSSLVQILIGLKAAGKIGGDPRWVALTLFVSTHSLAFFELMGAHGGRFTDEMLEGVFTSLWEGLQPCPAR